MRRKDREITSFSDIADIIGRCDTVRLALNGEEYPYVVPLSFGYERENDKINIYFHSASAGEKIDRINRDNRVCLEFDILNSFAEVPGSATAYYESVMAFGRAERIYGDEAEKGLDLLMEHCGFGGVKYNCPVNENVAVYKVTLEKISGKRNEKRHDKL